MIAAIESIEDLNDAFAMAQLGDLSLIIGFLLTALLIVLCAIGIIVKDERLIHACRRGQYLALALMAYSSALLLAMIFSGDFVSSYVTRVSELEENFFFKLTGLWASQEGSLLFWGLILSFCGAAYAFSARQTRVDKRLPYTLLVFFCIQLFFLGVLQFQDSSPFTLFLEWMNRPEFEKLSAHEVIAAFGDQLQGFRGYREILYGVLESGSTATQELRLPELFDRIVSSPEQLPENVQQALLTVCRDGDGMNPQLHNYWIAIHPPTLYVGYIGFTIPFCYAMGALLSGDLGSDWIRRARLWTMASWVFLTAGIAMGGLWAYEILGWGGYWAWDPVENASFIPWLTATAFIHSVIVQERRGLLRVWNLVLIIITYSSTIVGTLLVRSGIIESVHAFGDTGLKWPLLIFLGVVVVVSLCLLVYRYPLLKNTRRLESLISREGVFLINNLVLLGIAAITVVMTLWPAITEFFWGTGGRQQFRESRYNLLNIPLFLLLFFLTGAGPLLAYGRNGFASMRKQFAKPLLFGGMAFVLNATYLVISGSIVETEVPAAGEVLSSDQKLSNLLGYVLKGSQFVVIPLAIFVVSSVLQELFASARIRQEKGSAKGNAYLKTLLANRRRFGGYICHIGFALVACGIYFSTMYEIDTSVEIAPGEYATLGDKWVIVNDGHETSELFEILHDSRDPNSDTQMKSATRLNAVIQFWNDPDLTVGSLLEAIGASGDMREIPEDRIAEMTKGLTWAYEVAAKRRQSSDKRAYEFYRTSVRIFPFQSVPEDDPDIAEFRKLYNAAFLARIKAFERKEVPDVGHPAKTSFEALSNKAYELGPFIFGVLREIEGAQRDQLDEHRFFQRKLISALHFQEQESALSLCTKVVAGDESARALLERMGWRALGGLRKAEAKGGEHAKVARPLISQVLRESKTVKPQIKSFWNKQTGEPRPLGESVRDPEIHRYLGEDVYLILQDIRGGSEEDSTNQRAILRAFVKPGMNIAILGLLIMLFGATFAALPTQRCAKPRYESPQS